MEPVIPPSKEGLEPSETRGMWGDLALLSAAAILLRLPWLASRPISCDEAYTISHYGIPRMMTALCSYAVPNNHVFHSVLVNIARRLFGIEPWAMRLPALVAGVFLVPLVYLLCRRLAGRLQGFFTAGIVAISAPMIFFSTNARGYTLHLLLLTGAVLLALAILRHPRRWGLASLGFIALNGLALWTLPTHLLAFGGLGVWMALETCLRSTTIREALKSLLHLFLLGVASVFLGLLLYLPVVLTDGQGFRAIFGNQFVQSLEPSVWFSALSWAVPGWFRYLHGDLPSIVVWVLNALLVIGIASPFLPWGRTPREARVSLFAILFLVAFLLSAMQFLIPPERSFLFLLPFYWLAVASGGAFLVGLTLRGRRLPEWLSLGATGAIVAIIAIATLGQRGVQGWDEGGNFRGADEALAHIETRWEEGERLIAPSPGGEIFEYLMHANPGRNLPPMISIWAAEPASIEPGDVFWVVLKRDRWEGQSRQHVLDFVGFDPEGRGDRFEEVHEVREGSIFRLTIGGAQQS